MIKTMPCIVCPLGCELTAVITDDGDVVVSGNQCKRGAEYARTECRSPMRMLTTTMLTDSGELLPVKTSHPIPKDMLMEAMKIINKAQVSLPVHCGDVIMKNIGSLNADIVATMDME